MTLGDMLSDLYGSLGYADSPPANVTTRLTRYVNDGYVTLLRLPGFTQMRQKTIPLASVLNQKLYGIAPSAVQILKISDQTNNISLLEMSLDLFRRVDPQELVTGVPTHYVHMGLQSVKLQPSTSGVWVSSSSASDTTQTVRLVGLTTTGETAVQTATITGTSRVQVGALTTLTNIVEWNISAACVGTITLHNASTLGDELAVIQPGATSVQYLLLRLWPTAQGAYDYVIDIQNAVPMLTAAADVPVIPEDFHTMLVEYGRMREYEYRADDRFVIAKSLFDKNLRALTVRLWNTPDFLPVAGTIPNVASNLGSWYPPGRW